MTWTLENLQTGLAVTVPPPEPGDRHRFERRQASGETEGGRLFVQDLQRTDQFLEGSWSGINRCHKEDLTRFFESVLYRARTFKLVTTGGGAHVPSGAGGNWSGRVRLDQSLLDFRAVLTGGATGERELFDLTMRFRVFPTVEVVVSDVVQALDSVSLAGSTLALSLAGDSVATADTVGVTVT